MERIDIHNYEAYLLDYSEGNLREEVQIELELFLIQHPELDIDLAELSPVSIEKEVVYYSEKNKLNRSETDLVSETQFLAYIEQQLPLQELLHVEKSCEINPSLLKELNLYKSTIAVPDADVIYSDKHKLKRKPKVVWFDFSFIHYAAAACVVFLIGLFVLWSVTDTENQTEQLAGKSNINSGLKAVVNAPSINQSQIALKTSAQKSPVSKHKQVNKKVFSHQKKIILPKDSSLRETIAPEPISELKPNEPLIASTISPVTKHSANTIVQVITETGEEQEIKAEPRKKDLWALASKALKNLNQAGVKSVNGDESSNSEKTGYALTLGGLNITHKPANL